MQRRNSWHYALAVAILSILLAGCGATSIESVEPSLTGTWYGECDVDLPIVFNPSDVPEDIERIKMPVALAITIHEDAVVDGKVGEATIGESMLKRNRGELGRQLNVATDYVIIDGHLSGPIVSGNDEVDLKEFSIPFNLVDDQIRGSLFWRQQRKYPFPLCSRLTLERRP